MQNIHWIMNRKPSFVAFLLVLLSSVAFAVSVGETGVFLSNFSNWDNRGNSIVNGDVRISPTASGNAMGSLKVDRKAASDWSESAPSWNTRSVEDGWHFLTLNGDNANAQVVVLNNPSYAIHDGLLESDEFWSKDKIHIVRNWVRIPEGKRLVISNGALVKFCPGTGILNSGMLSALEATMTSINDDTRGGDTLMDEDAGTALDGSYQITGDGVLNALWCEMHYATADSVLESTTISDNAFAGCDSVTRVVIPPSVTEVGQDAFRGCSGLVSVTLPIRLREVGEAAFRETPALTDVYYTLDNVPLDYGNALVHIQDIPGAGIHYFTDELTLQPGWNLVALPEKALSEQTKTQLLEQATPYEYDRVKQTYVLSRELLPRKVYWLFSESEVMIRSDQE